MLVGGDPPDRDRPVDLERRGRAFLPAGLVVALAYVADLDVQRQAVALADRRARRRSARSTSRGCKRPSWPVLFATAFAGVAGRGDRDRLAEQPQLRDVALRLRRSILADFDPAKILESLNIEDEEDEQEVMTYETDEYGGFLLMMDTVPEKSDYDYGGNYLRIVLDLHPPDRLARQAALRPRASGSPPGSPARSSSATRTSPARRSASWGRPSSTAAPSGR